MPGKLNMMLEAERRGMLKPEHEPILAEARKRGMVPGGGNVGGNSQESGGSFLGEMASNIPSSGMQFAKDITYPVRHPAQTVEGLTKLAVGGIQKAVPGDWRPSPESDRTQHADAVGQFFAERYGGMDKVKETLKNDPVGFAADISAILTGGGLAAAKVGGKVGAVGSKVANAGMNIDPLIAGGKAVGKVSGGVGKVASEVAGRLTGTGGETIRVAAKSGVAGGESGKAFRDAMRNKVDPVETVGLAKDALREMHAKKSAAYREGMGKVSGDPYRVEFRPCNGRMEEHTGR